MKLYYYFTKGCSSCKAYNLVARQLALDFNIDEVEEIDIGEQLAKHSLKGVPTIIVEDKEGNEVFRSLGNTPIKYLEEAYDKRGAC